jgi:nicotinamidase-related amidase
MRSRAPNRLANRAIAGLGAAAVRRQLAYAPIDTALLLVGPQPDLLPCADTVAALTRLLTTVRAAGLPVIYVPAARPTPRDGIRFPTPSQHAVFEDELLRPGSTGAGVHPELAPSAGDLVLAPHPRLSAFAQTGLAVSLSDLGIRRIVVAGARTDIEVDSTARDAVELGLQTTVVADCCTGTSPENHRATVSITLPRIVHGVLKLDEIARQLSSHLSKTDNARIHARTHASGQRHSQRSLFQAHDAYLARHTAR